MITRVYGKADNWELEFKQDGSAWVASVPANMADGQYVVGLYAVNDYGYVSYYTGILYMFDGRAVIELQEDDIVFGYYADDNGESLVIGGRSDRPSRFFRRRRSGMSAARRGFILGEEKYLDFQVKSKTGQQLVVKDATYKVMSNGRVLQEGSCAIDGQRLRCLLKPSEIGCMYLEVECYIAPETRKARAEIEVV